MCDHYSLLPGGPTAIQQQRCVGYYVNNELQPFYTRHFITLMFIIGLVSLVRRVTSKCSVYDWLSLPLASVAISVFVAVIEPARKVLTAAVAAGTSTKQVTKHHCRLLQLLLLLFIVVFLLRSFRIVFVHRITIGI